MLVIRYTNASRLPQTWKSEVPPGLHEVLLPSQSKTLEVLGQLRQSYAVRVESPEGIAESEFSLMFWDPVFKSTSERLSGQRVQEGEFGISCK